MAQANYTLSPCVQSAVSDLSDDVTAWDFARVLFVMHPECTNNKMAPHLAQIDLNYRGEKQMVTAWLGEIAKNFPEEGLLHTRLVLWGLYTLDPALKMLLPKDAMAIIAKDLGYSVK